MTLEAKFLVEPAEAGVLACGFIVRAAGRRALLLRPFRPRPGDPRAVRREPVVERDQARRRVGQAGRPMAHRRLQATGDTLRVSLNGKLLYEAKDAAFAPRPDRLLRQPGHGPCQGHRRPRQGREGRGKFVVPPPLFVYVCKDAGAGAYEAFPDVCRLSDGRLMSVFYAGYGHVALPNAQLPKGGRICYCTSATKAARGATPRRFTTAPTTTAIRRSSN